MCNFKKAFSIILSLILTVSFTLLNVHAMGETRITESIDIIDVINNPEKYPDIKVTVETPYEYINTLKQDKLISPQQREVLINEAQHDLLLRSTTETYSYVTIKRTVTVTSEYSCYPYFRFKAQTFGGVPALLVSLNYANIDRAYNGISKQFGGTLFVNLDDSTNFYWDLNGDFYNNGTTTGGFSGSINVGNVVNIGFSASETSNHYKYIQHDENYHFRA